jgi:hypothetical protein
MATSPQVYARVAGGFYLGTILTGALAAASVNYRVTGNLIATACYVAVTLLFYHLFLPVSGALSLAAAVIGLVGCAWGALGSFGLSPFSVSPLVFFGFYCLLIGYLVFRSTFLPRLLGVLMAFGGLGWLTFAWPSLASSLAPFNMLPGVLGEGVLTLWLLIKGVDVRRWNERARAERPRPVATA